MSWHIHLIPYCLFQEFWSLMASLLSPSFSCYLFYISDFGHQGFQGAAEHWKEVVCCENRSNCSVNPSAENIISGHVPAQGWNWGGAPKPSLFQVAQLCWWGVAWSSCHPRKSAPTHLKFPVNCRCPLDGDIIFSTLVAIQMVIKPTSCCLRIPGTAPIYWQYVDWEADSDTLWSKSLYDDFFFVVILLFF